MTWDGGAAADPRFDTAWSGTPPWPRPSTTPCWTRRSWGQQPCCTAWPRSSPPFSGATCFPQQLLERTHLRPRTAHERPRRCHIAVVSDSGVTSMMDDVEDALGCPGVAERALEAAGGGGTLLLDCSETTLMRLRLPAGYETVSVTTMEDVLSRSRELGRRVWREKPMR